MIRQRRAASSGVAELVRQIAPKTVHRGKFQDSIKSSPIVERSTEPSSNYLSTEKSAPLFSLREKEAKVVLPRLDEQILSESRESDDEEGMESLLFKVKDIKQIRYDKSQPLYRVRWHDTWEPEDNLEDCKDLVHSFRQMNPQATTVTHTYVYQPHNIHNTMQPSTNVSQGITVPTPIHEEILETSSNVFINPNYLGVGGNDDLEFEYIFEEENSADDSVALVEFGEGDPAVEPIFSLAPGASTWSTSEQRHLVGSEHKCRFCDFTGRKVDVNNHELTHDGIVHYVCEHCGLRVKQEQALKKHIERFHTDGQLTRRMWKCKMCPYQHASKWKVKEHTVVHSNERPYVCDICGKAHKSAHRLRHHRYSHGQGPRFKRVAEGSTPTPGWTIAGPRNILPDLRCPSCDFVTKWQEVLNRHIVKHRKSFSCEVCRCRFDSAVELGAHVTKQHTTRGKPVKMKPKVKSHFCEECGKGFYTRSQMIAHVALHGDERNFACEQCDARYKSAAHLSRHRRVTHGGRRMPEEALLEPSRTTKAKQPLLPGMVKRGPGRPRKIVFKVEDLALDRDSPSSNDARADSGSDVDSNVASGSETP